VTRLRPRQPARNGDSLASPSDARAAGRLAANPGFLAARFASVAATVSNRALAPFGLRTRSYALVEIAVASGGLSQQEVARALWLDKAHVVRLVDEVAAMGLVVRTRDPRDGRVWLIRATPQGAAVAEDAGRALDEAFAELLRRLSEDEVAAAVTTLRRLAFELEGPDGEG
jgi:DNA-binding MarR family transcriptional regulator